MNSSQLDDEEIFHTARMIDTAPARAKYLQDACGQDDILLEQVTALLRVYNDESSFLESPALSLGGTADRWAFSEKPGTEIGPYKLVEQIGAGGMGLVFMAEQQQPLRRAVALKIIKPGMDTRQVITRFETERQVLAMMDHPHIATVLDAGTTDSGRPFFVMELVRGLPITNYCDSVHLAIRERLQLFVSVCEAVQHAHQKGIIHRDIKPSNILMTIHDEKAVPKVIDFGVAKAINQQFAEQTLITNVAQMLGTPTYMSPEQAATGGLDVDTRSDVYSLGVLLYELLTGTTPFEKSRLNELTNDELRYVIREEDPPRPSTRVRTFDADLQATYVANRAEDWTTLNQTLNGDLDWIVMKALEKDRTRRYESVSALMADVKRYLADEPVEACPPTTGYRLRKFVRRSKPLIELLSLVTGFVMISVIGLVIGYILLSREKDEVQRQKALVQAHENRLDSQEHTIRNYLYAADLQLTFLAYARGEVSQAQERLVRHLSKSESAGERGFEWHYLMNLCSDNVARTARGHQRDVFGVHYSKDGLLLVSTSADRRAVLWDTAAFEPRRVLSDLDDDVNGPAFNDDGTMLAIAEENKTVSVWDLRTGWPKVRLEGFTWPVIQVFFVGDQSLIATETEYRSGTANFSLWDIKNQRLVKNITGHRAVAVDSKTGVLASAELNGRISLWSLPELEQQANWQGEAGPVLCGAFSPDGQLLATGRRGTATLWSLTDYTGRQLPLSISTVIRGLAFTPDGSMLVTVGDDTIVRIWDVPSTTSLRMIQSTHGRLWSTDVSPDGFSLATACADGSIEVRDLSQTTMQKVRLQRSDIGSRDVAAARSGDQVAVVDNMGTEVTVLDATNGKVLDRFSAPKNEEISKILFSSDNKSLWTATTSGTLLRRNLKEQSWAQEVKKVRKTVRSLFQSPAGRFLNVADEIWDLETGRTVVTFDDYSSEFPWGFVSELMTVSRRGGNELSFANLETGVQVSKQLRQLGFMNALTATPDGKTLAIATASTVHLYDIPTASVSATLLGHRDSVTSMVFSPDGRTLVTGGEAGEIKLWHRPTSQFLCDFYGHLGMINLVTFSADGRLLFSWAGTPQGGSEVFVWGLVRGAEFR